MAAAFYRLMTRLAFALLLASGGATFAQLPPAGKTAITPQLIAETSAPAGGGKVTLAIVMRPLPGWHGYWQNPGDAGVPPTVKWTLSAGAAAGPLRYPVPGRLVVSGLMNYVYDSTYAHLVMLDVPPATAGTVLPVRAAMTWLACTDQICVPEHGDLVLDLPVGDGAATAESRAQFDGFRARLPATLAAPAGFAIANRRFRLGIPLPAGQPLTDAYFYPAEGMPFPYTAAQTFRQDGDTLIMETAAGEGAAPKRLEGVLSLGGRGFAITANPGTVARTPTQAGLAQAVLLAFLGALAGGLLLNVMPCVFPILSLKALSLAKANGSEASARREALAYTGGAVLTCAVLGAVLLALRASGEAAGWAFQLQEPRVILVLLLLTVAVALNLAGLFEVPTLGAGGALAGKSGTAGAFWTGALAAFVATPCTGPFLGAALGALLVLPPLAAMAIFVGLGLGLALPFLALGYIPALRRRLPRPGAWMDAFRRILSLPMFATALALAWVLGRQAGVSGMTIGLAAALAAALALWWLGRAQASGSRRAWLPAVPVAAALALAMLVLPGKNAAPASTLAGPLSAQAFDETRLAALRAEGRPVFLYFTADWCVSCKVNEKIAIDRAETADAFAKARVAVMVGDWTNGDPAIGRFLERQGRSGVPLYLYYAPGKEPRVLPQLLTAGLLAALAGT